jgi:addiction module HigA family antidote
MAMHNPPHPGEFIRTVYLEPFSISSRFLATKLDVSPSTLNRVIKGVSGISPDMALRLSKALGRSPESWLAMQDNYDLWQARQRTNLENVDKVEFDAARADRCKNCGRLEGRSMEMKIMDYFAKTAGATYHSPLPIGVFQSTSSA